MKIFGAAFLLPFYAASACHRLPAPSDAASLDAPSQDAGSLDSASLDAPSPRLDARTPDAAHLCDDACAKLKRLGCAEGSDPQCSAVCRHAETSRVTDLRIGCLAAATSKAAARACASVTCP